MKKFHMLAWLLVFSLVFSGCSNDNEQSTTPQADASNTSQTTSTENTTADTTATYDLAFTSRDLDIGYEESDATILKLEDSSATIDGNGATAENGIVTITASGTYILSGNFTGQIVVEAGEADKVQLVLDNATIENQSGPAIYLKAADKVFVTLATDSINTLRDGDNYTLDASETSNLDGVVYSKVDVTFNGNGTLNVTGNYNHGIVSKDDLVITSGTYIIDAVGQGLHGKDCVKIKEGTFTITSGGDAIQADNVEDATRGFVYLAGGNYTIASGNDGIQAETLLQIDGGEFSITTGGGSENASTKESNTWGNWGKTTTTETTETTEESTSAKGLKSGVAMLMQGGTFTIDASDDALHTNGDLTISDGTFSITTGDDGMHADSSLIIDGGSIDITKSYEGIEATAITINGGDISVVASDDGMNAAGGNDGSSMDGRMGQNSFASNETTYISITGGTLCIDASGDGIDSNGSLSVTGGTVIVDGPTSGGDGALDYDSTATITGGNFLALGSSGMAQGFSSTSTQYSALVNFSSTVSVGETLTIADANGTTVFEYTAKKNFQSVVFSSPDLQQNETYTLTAGSQSTTVTLDSIAAGSSGMGGFGGGGMMGGGNRKNDATMPNDDGQSRPEPTEGERPTMPTEGEMPELPANGELPSDSMTPPDNDNFTLPNSNNTQT